MCSEPTVHFQFCLRKFVNIAHIYRPQRSWGKVIFLYLSVILFTGGGSASVHAGIPPPGPGRHPLGPGRHPPPDQMPLGPGIPRDQAGTPRPDPPGTRHSPGAEHTERYGQRAGGMHPIGMQSCLVNDIFARHI